MKQRAKTVAAKPPATRPAVMFLRAVSRSTAGFLSVPAARGLLSAEGGSRQGSLSTQGYKPFDPCRDPLPTGRTPSAQMWAATAIEMKSSAR